MRNTQGESIMFFYAIQVIIILGLVGVMFTLYGLATTHLITPPDNEDPDDFPGVF